MTDPKYPRSAKYDTEWIYNNQMGSHCLWLLESLTNCMKLEPGMRVLDLGAGTAISSIFLAKEFGCQVWASEFWVSATDNWRRIEEAGVGHLVFPIHAEAHSLPFAEGYFDAMVTVNTLQFFATSEYYMAFYLAKLIRAGGQMGVVVPGVYEEFDGDVPDYLKPRWQGEFYSWHSPGWWRRHWQRSGLVDVRLADDLEDGEGHAIFRKWEIITENGEGLCRRDEGRNITFVRMVAERIG